jgi:hypothetical protein
MSLLRRTRGELAGAWRSLRYDLGRQPAEPPAGGPDVTSTGMNTFGGHVLAEEPPTGHERHRPPPRRALAVSVLGLLTVVGAAGAYLAVVNGLGSIAPERPAAADTFPVRPAVTSDAEIGSGPAPRPGRPAKRTATATSPATSPAAAGPVEAAQVPPLPGVPAATPGVGPVRTTKPTSTECKCNPPVPTPTAPTSSPSPTPSADPSGPSETPLPSESSATPDESAEPRDSRRHRYWRRRH